MSATNAFETDILKAIFQAVFGGSATTLFRDSAAPATNIYVSLHTADPGETGDQTTSETSYTGYARVAVARTSGGWAVSGNTADNVAEVTFGQNTAGTPTITHTAVGLSSSGTGTLLLSAALDTPLVMAPGATPLFSAGELNYTCD